MKIMDKAAARLARSKIELELVERDWRLEHLAVYAEVPYNTLAAIMRGQRTVTRSTGPAIARAFGWQHDWWQNVDTRSTK